MAKRKVKKTVKQSASSPGSNINDANAKEPRIERKEDAIRDDRVECQNAAIRAIRDMEIEHMLTGLCLLRSYFNKEQLQTPVHLFFKENLPNLSIVRNGKDGQFEVQWKDKDGKFSLNQVDGSNIHASLLHQMSIAYPDCSAAMPSFSGFELSSKEVKTSFLGANDLQIRDFVLEEPSETRMLGLQDAFQTPGPFTILHECSWIYNILLLSDFQHGTINMSCIVSSQRLSVGMTPKTLRLPKHGEMLLSVRGSPLGVYEEDNMEVICESEEG
ncbi:hypothetical protein L1049_002358 [Liquidambar formosana]|uniref:Borealin C-terminal domain-containing protein n=1 Tax=Liquidambar formosana TaxID=63359 RepID=A0AAP0NJF1_LIQFO